MLNIKNIPNKEEITRKFRFFFGDITWKKSLTFLFFLLLAIIFWVVQAYSSKMEIKLSIPIHYSNIADNILFDHELPTQIDVYIKDYGSAALKYVTKRDDSIKINLSGLTSQKSASDLILQGQEFEQLIKSKLLPSSELISFTPAYISYTYSLVSVRRLPVLFDGVANLSVGYQLDGDISITPDSVLVLGPKAVLDTLIYAYTVRDTLDIDNNNQNINVQLAPIHGVEFRPKDIQLNVPVDKFIEREVKVPVECINLPSDLNIKFFPPEVSVSFFTGSKRNNLVSSSDFKIIVDYLDIKDRELNAIPVRVVEYPEFTRIKSLEPSEVEYILEQQ